MSRITKRVYPFYWHTAPNVTFTQGQSAQRSLKDFLYDPQRRVQTVTLASGTLPAGVTINGFLLEYNGVGAVGSASLVFRASSANYTIDSASGTTQIQASTQPPVNTAPQWTVPEPYTLPSFTTAGGSYNLAQHAYDAEGDAFTFTRTGGTAPGSVTVSSDGVLTVPAGLSADSYDVTVSLSASGDADWEARTENAIWAHRFDEDWEVDWFRVNQGPDVDLNQTDLEVAARYGAGGEGYVISAQGQTLYRDPTGGPNGRPCLVAGPVHSDSYVATLQTPLTAAQTTGVTITVSTPPPTPAGGWQFNVRTLLCLYESPTKYEFCQMRAVNGNQITVDRGNAAQNQPNIEASAYQTYDWAAGAQIRYPVTANSKWMRPFSPLKYQPATQYTKGAAPSITQDNGWTSTKPLFSPTRENGGEWPYNWRFGYYAHADYTAASRNEPNPVLAKDANKRLFTPDATYPTWDVKDGTEFYLQMRVKISGDRYPYRLGSDGQKWIWLTGGDATFQSQEFILTPSYNGVVDFYNHSYVKLYKPQMSNSAYYPAYPGGRYAQPGYGGGTCVTGIATKDADGPCFYIPPDTWTTLLYHMVCGHEAGTRTWTALAQNVSPSDTTIYVTDRSKLPQIDGVNITGFVITLCPSALQSTSSVPTSERVRVTGFTGANGLTVIRAGQTGAVSSTAGSASTPQSFVAGDAVQTRQGGVPEQMDQLHFRNAYPNTTRFRLLANRPGIDPAGQYITVMDHDHLALLGSRSTLWGWNTLWFSAYDNGGLSFMPWKYQMAECIFSDQFIPCPQDTP